MRTRDPARRERILTAAADLLAQRGFHAVSMADIGATAGITGSGIYRHFGSKSAVLVELFDRVIDALVADGRGIVADAGDDPVAALAKLVAGQVQFVVGDRELAQVYHREVHSLPETDRRRLRRKQRIYVELWVGLLTRLRPGAPENETRAVVHAAIGAIQSSLFQHTGLAEERARVLLAAAARAVLDAAIHARTAPPGGSVQ